MKLLRRMAKTSVLALSVVLGGYAGAVEKLEPVVRPDGVAWKKYDIKEGVVEYDFRVRDGKLNGYVILPDGVEADLHWNGEVTRVKGPRTKFGTPIPLLAEPRYLKDDHNGLQTRWAEKTAALKALKGGEIDLVLVGDSITHFWDDPKKGEPVLKELQKHRSVISLGYGGDGTQHTIWRIRNGELDGYRAKTIALMIGVNNGGETWDDVAAGVKECVRLIREKQPQAKLILQGILPWGEKNNNYHRVKDAKTNEEIRKLADDKDVFWLDFGQKLLNARGELTREMASDFVHPNTKGYEIWRKALLPLVVTGRGELALTADGLGCSYIQLRQYASAIEQRAARELSEGIRKIAKVHVPWHMVSAYGRDGLDGATEIAIRTLDGHWGIPADVRRKLEATDNPEAYVIRSARRADGTGVIHIVGKTDIATLYGTYAFMEDQLGVRWLHPGPSGTVWPAKPSVTVPDNLLVFREPWVGFRHQSTWFGCVKPLDHAKDVEPYQLHRTYQYHEYGHGSLSPENAAHMQFGNMWAKRGGELLFGSGVPMSLFDAHPEYFPLVDGKRSWEVGQQDMRRCCSNPAVMELSLQYALRHLETDHAFGIDHRDAHEGWCECAECIKYGTGRDGRYTVPNYALRFDQELAERILEKCPDAQLEILIYRDYRDPVSNDVRFPKQVLALYCPHQRCYAHPLTAPCNRMFREQYDFWNARCASFGTFDYYAYSGVPYCPVEYVLAEDFRYYMKSNYRGWLEDTSSHSGGKSKWPLVVSNWQMYYVASKMMWDRTADVRTLLGDAYDRYYGPAAAVMKKYHARRLELWNACPAHAAMSNFFRPAYCLEPAGAKEELFALLDAAAKAAADDQEVLTRIGLDREMFENIWVLKNEEMRKAKAEQQAIGVSRRTGAIVIDGELDDAGWKDAFRVPDFNTVHIDYSGKKYAPEAAPEATHVRAAYDDDAWYVAFEAMLDATNTPVVAKKSGRDANVWEDDSVELYLNPPYDGYYHFIINSKGALYDSEGQGNKRFDSQAEVKARLCADRYVVEMRIPVKPMHRERIEKGETWNIHFGRNHVRLGSPVPGKKGVVVSSLDATWPHAATKFRRVEVK